MLTLAVGLVLFLGIHSLRIFAEPLRGSLRERMGANAWRGIYSVVSIASFALIVWGYGEARMTSTSLWWPPVWTRHVAALLTVPAFVFFATSNVKGTRIKARLKHPLLLGTKTWAFAHLLSNGRVADVLLFGSFLVWSILCFRASRKRDRAESIVYPPGSASQDAIAIALGIALWALFAFYLHARLIGVAPFGVTG
jgi:uncharacterized membrane protein